MRGLDQHIEGVYHPFAPWNQDNPICDNCRDFDNCDYDSDFTKCPRFKKDLDDYEEEED